MHTAGLATVAYYHFGFRDVKNKDCHGLFSFIFQLSAKSDSCYNVLSELCSNNNRDMREPDIDALKECLADMLGLPGQGHIIYNCRCSRRMPQCFGTPSARGDVLESV